MSPTLRIIVIVPVLIISTSSSHTPNYKGQNLNFVIFHNPPYDFFTPGPNKSYTYGGATFNIVKWLGAKLNFTYTLVPVNETIAEKYGVHEASFFQLINDKNIDGISCPFYVTVDRKERMDFTFLAWSEGFNLIVPRSGEESRLFAFIGPFQPIVWLFMLLSIITMVGMMSFFMWFYNNYYSNLLYNINGSPRRKIAVNHANYPSDQNRIKPVRQKIFSYLVSSNMIYIINIMTNQGSKEGSGRFSFRVLAGFWLLGAMVLVNCYSGIVISSLTVPKMMPTIESLEDLAASEDVGIVLRHDMSMGEQILQATSGVYKVLGDQARRNPKQIVGDHVKLNAMLETGRYAYPMIQTFCAFFIATQYKKEGHCRFKLSKRLTVSPGYYSLLMKKGSRQVQEFSRELMNLWESGLVRLWVYNNVPRADECFATDRQRTSARQVPIQLSDLTSAFLILGIGLGSSAICFLLEFTLTNSSRHVKSTAKSSLILIPKD